MKPEEVISLLPYSKPFLFVDTLDKIDENSVTGSYTFKEDEYFYKGHFTFPGTVSHPKNISSRNFPLTPGVILTETMAQIGVVCLGIFLFSNEFKSGNYLQFALSSAQTDFFLPVYPGEKVTVISEKVYFRFGKLKCNVHMINSRGDMVCKGVISGMIIK